MRAYGDPIGVVFRVVGILWGVILGVLGLHGNCPNNGESNGKGNGSAVKQVLRVQASG